MIVIASFGGTIFNYDRRPLPGETMLRRVASGTEQLSFTKLSKFSKAPI
ncbi:hypothetical protein [Fulvivirga kasyanovii]|nr:hypothetical protein [Fulvivirga kasyanovii]